MRMLRRAVIAALAAVAVVAPVSSHAAPDLNFRANIVGFWGNYKGPGKVSITSVCNQVYYNGTGTGIFPCIITFTITRGTDVCDIAAGQSAGTANYYSNISPDLDRTGVPLTGADFDSSGVVTGVVQGTSASDVFTIRISFVSICEGEQPTRQFVGDGHLA
jgi:hypothetical protein